jgi:homocysteine S-methyltransferase
MQTFLERMKDPSPILLDGATGTELNHREVPTELPLWSAQALIDAPNTLAQIHFDYLKAGAEVLTTNTFRTHRRSLAKAGMGDRARELTLKAVEIPRQVISVFMEEGGHPAWVAGSIAPLEDCYTPELVPPQEECLAEHAEMANNLAEAGVNLLLIETMNSIREAEAAASAAQNTQLPFIISFVLQEDGNLFSGESLAEAIYKINGYHPMLVGVNCASTQIITKALAELKTYTDLPLSGYGNIGHSDDEQGWKKTNEVSPDTYAQAAISWIDMGVRMVGGCCGTSPSHIQAVSIKLNQKGENDAQRD